MRSRPHCSLIAATLALLAGMPAIAQDANQAATPSPVTWARPARMNPWPRHRMSRRPLHEPQHYGKFSYIFDAAGTLLNGGDDDAYEPNDSCAADRYLGGVGYNNWGSFNWVKIYNEDYYRLSVPDGGTISSSTRFASGDGSTTCGSSSSTTDAWYYYYAHCTGVLNIDIYGNNFDTVLSAHSACPENSHNPSSTSMTTSTSSMPSPLDAEFPCGSAACNHVAGRFVSSPRKPLSLSFRFVKLPPCACSL